MGYLVGVDLGTSGTKTVLFDPSGRALAGATAEYPLYQPEIGWAEQDPDDWWRAVCETIAAVIKKSGVNTRDIRALGLSGQMHGLVLLDRDGAVLRRSIIWCDQRTGRECDQIHERVGRERLIQITANPALTGFTASKLLWVRNHEPGIFERTAKVLLPKDYIRYRLTGEYATEVSGASGTQFLDVSRRAWSAEVLDRLGIPADWMPAVYESYEISGRLTRQAAALTGLPEGLPVAGGGGDQAAGAVGNGIVRAGVVSSTIGTSGVVFAHTDSVRIDPGGRVHTFCHAVPGCWHIMGVTQGAGLSYRWFRDEFCAVEQVMARRLGVDPYKLMGEQARRAQPGCGGLIYLPHLMGERTPHLDPAAKGVFFGLSARHTRADMIRAVMEGVTYSLLDALCIIREMGVDASEVRASGGGARSPLWRQMQADMFGARVRAVESGEGPALGAALLAGVGAGVYGSVPEACDAAVRPGEEVQPDERSVRVYRRLYPIYRGLYAQLKPSYDRLAETLEALREE